MKPRRAAEVGAGDFGKGDGFGKINFNVLLYAGVIQTHARFIAMGLKHELKGGAKVLTALIERMPVSQGAGNFFDPADKAVGLRFDDGVVVLEHGVSILDCAEVHSQ